MLLRGTSQVEYFTLRLDGAREESSESVAVLDVFDFTDQPKFNAAVIYVRALPDGTRWEDCFFGNRSEYLIPSGEGDSLLESDEEFRRQELPPYGDEARALSEQLFGFADVDWDTGLVFRWLSGRTIVSGNAGFEEVLVLAPQRVGDAFSSVQEQMNRAAGGRGDVLAEMEFEDTRIARPGLRTPPVFYISRRRQ
jgi:hypothetical protein